MMTKFLTAAALAVTMLSGSSRALGQMPYNVTSFNASYQPLSNATNLTSGLLWSDTTALVIPVGFSFKYGSAVISSLHLYQTTLFLADTTGVQSGFAMIGTGLQDRGLPSGTAVSPIRYTLTGNPGSKIFKLEFKDAGFATEWAKYQTAQDSINLQIWIYEASGAIEFRFGPSNVSNFSDYFAGSVPFGYFSDLDLSTFAFNKFYCLKGNPVTPLLDSVTDLSNPVGVDSFPADGTVYAFTHKSPATGVKVQPPLTKGRVYPVPAHDDIYIESGASEYEVLSLSGSIQAQGTLSGGRTRVSLTALTPGMYLLRLRKGVHSDMHRILKH